VQDGNVEQAKGVPMVQHAIPADQAHEMLMRRSEEDDTMLREVARALLGSVTGPLRPQWPAPTVTKGETT
jgi:AmiR/NasT family two-component response regulator